MNLAIRTTLIAITVVVVFFPQAAHSQTFYTEMQKTYFLRSINNFRVTNDKSPVQTDSYTCELARQRVKEIQKNFSHAGFFDRANKETLPYPAFQKATENLAQIYDYRDVINRWIASPTHAKVLLSDTPFACVESNGNYYAYEAWKPDPAKVAPVADSKIQLSSNLKKSTDQRIFGAFFNFEK